MTDRAAVDTAPTPAQNLEAEESVLGAMMLTPAAIDAVSVELGDGAAFYRPSHRMIYQAALALHGRDVPVDAITLTAELKARGELDQVGGRKDQSGKARIQELAALVPAAGNAGHYARLIREAAQRRREEAAAPELSTAASNGGLAVRPQLREQLREIIDGAEADGTVDPLASPRRVDGAAFVFDEPDTVPAVWGEDGVVLWAEGEGLMLVGPDGVGKTTLMQQLTLARVGIRTEPLLGLDVATTAGRVLYIAADRPRQAARSLRRMVGDADRAALSERLIVWRGPLPFDLTTSPRALAQFALRLDVDSVFIDSLKDVALDLAEDKTGSRVNLALQELIASDIDFCASHHQRKAQEGNKKPTKLADVYGSRWLTAGMGSVVCLWGDPGDPVVELSHLKQPAEQFGPVKIVHDHTHGITTIHEAVNLDEVLNAAGIGGISCSDVARQLYDVTKPTPAQTEKARRQLNRLVETGHAEQRPALDGSTRYSLRDLG